MRFRFEIAFVVILMIGVSSCGSDQSNNVIDDKGISYVEKEDPEMQKAIEESRNTFSEFLSAYHSKDSSIQGFAIKFPFDAGEGNEHMWLNNITIEDDKIYGVVNNDPQLTEDVALGDTVEIDRSKISDWNYIKGDTLFGGFSIKLFRNRMTPQERAEFDKSTGLVIN